MTLSPTLIQRIETLAQRKQTTPEAVLTTLLDRYEQSDPVEDFIGAFDDDVVDLSLTVRETLKQHFGKPDDGAA